MGSSTRRTVSFAAYGAVSVVFAALLWGVSGSGLSLDIHPIDFTAFYCGGKVFAGGLDPYLEGPLRACEAAAYRDIGSAMQPYLVVPVPFPPYVLWAFSAVRFVPFHVATRLCFVALIIALTLTVAITARLTKLPLAVVIASLLVADGIASLVIGQIVPLVVLALAASALALSSQRYGVATALAAATLIEPHVGLPVCATLAVTIPQTRRRLALVAAGLVLLSLVPAPARALEYVTRVVPAQGRVEGANFSAQYSITAFTHFLGAPLDVSLAVGTLTFAGMLVLGAVVARKLAYACSDLAYVVLVPPAFALLGGAYVHIHQIAAALPLALTLYTRVRGKAVLVAAIVALAVPWQTLYEDSPLGGLVPQRHVSNPLAELRAAYAPNVLAEVSWNIWSQYRSAVDGRTPLEAIIIKLPTWFGLVTICWLSYRVGRARMPGFLARPLWARHRTLRC